MERQIPKNVRQIGNVSDSPKIYVEDYVDTFFTQLCEKAGEEPIGAFLVGDMQKTNDEEYVYIYGAIQIHDLKMSDKEYVIDDDAWKRAYEECKQYFEDGEMLGWFVAHQGVPLEPEHKTVKFHKKSFPKKNSVFIMKDPIEKDEAYYVLKLNDLMEIGGHYTYYEKNPCMQNYMISTRKKNGVCASETFEDRAAKDFRSLVRSREEQQHQKRTNRLMYAVSACLVLVVIIMGVTTLNNFDKMKSVQSTLNNISDSSSSDTQSVKTKETSGKATAVTNESSGQQIQEDGQSGVEEKDESGQAGDTPENSETANTDTQSTDAAGANGDDGVYIVEQGDTLAVISRKTYGDVSHVDAICKMNGLSNGNLIYVGQKLVLP
ncbi:LysM peptidoglycan-binding domain-containing protein [Clostridium sp. C105KSO13]|uniref:LysM peptidoglycan-binding domain-containing protein n=1 Tax=Clostridium sp. C105KSO13 TaxID=1776045 RepID=UPI0007405F25|nr:LysM peptidoglycan-binding domain-containing protein [Clostridium sp. C105KSO13]CUX19865.1 LysM domain/BON superfamily protein [Clostridium sp. C105KSO13]